MRDHRTIGKIVGTFGLKGTLKVWSLTDFAEQRFADGATVYIDGEPYEVAESQWHKQQLRLRLKEVRRLEAAEDLAGKEITVPADERPELEEGEYLIEDLIGLEVFDTEGVRLGTLDEVIQGPAQDIYRVGEVLIPAVAEFVREIDMPNRRMVIAPIPGMFE